MLAFFEDLVMLEILQPIVVFVDEVDSLLSLNPKTFSTDDFFAAIRALYNARSRNKSFNRLSFSVIGVATPQDLMTDTARTPFNIGVPIILDNFSLVEAQPLMLGFHHLLTNHEHLLKEVLYWTGGQPYLSQKLSKSISDKELVINDIPDVVERHVNELFFSDATEKNDHNLVNVSNRILLNKTYNARMLSIYEQVLAGQIVMSNPNDYAQLYLKLSGLVREERGELVIANRIYEKKFDNKWLLNAFSKVDRPFAMEFNSWLKHNKSEDVTKLRPAVFNQIISWSRGRNDLSNLEREFIDALQATERKLQGKRNRKWRRGFFTAALFVIAFALVSLVALKKWQLSEQQKKEVDWQKQALKKVADTLLKKDVILKRAFKKIEAEKIVTDHQRQLSDSLKQVAENERDKISKMKESLRLVSLAQQIADENPTVALRLAQEATNISNNSIARDAINKLYSNHLFYRIVFEDKTLKHLAISPNNRYLVTANSDNEVLLRTMDGNEIMRMGTFKSSISALLFSPDNKYILIRTFQDSVYIHQVDLTDKRTQKTFAWKLNHNGGIMSQQFVPGKQLVVLGNMHSEALVVDFHGHVKHVIDGHSDYVSSVDVSPDGKHILTGSWDHDAWLWNIDGDSLTVIRGHNEPVTVVRFSPDGRWILTASKDETARLWDLKGRELQRFNSPDGAIMKLAFSPNNRYIATSSFGHHISLWDRTGKLVELLKGHEREINFIGFSPDGSYIYSSATDQTIRRWLLAGIQVSQLNGHNDAILSVDFSQWPIMS